MNRARILIAFLPFIALGGCSPDSGPVQVEAEPDRPGPALTLSATASGPVEFSREILGGYSPPWDGGYHRSPLGQAVDRALRRAIDPDDYVCSSPTPFELWIASLLVDIDDISLAILFDLGATSYPFAEKILLDHDDADEYLGTNGEYTRRLATQFRDQRRFWDVPSDDMLLMGAHGAVIADDARMLPLLALLFPTLPPEIRAYILLAVRTAIEGGEIDLTPLGAPFVYQAPGIPGGYDHPGFSLNALAVFDQEIPGIGHIQERIIMGDGLLQGLEVLGLDPEGGDYVLAHEFAHQVQWKIGAFEPGPQTPEGTRRTELMADGFGAYFAAHARGAAFQPRRFVDVISSAYNLGDCSFGSPQHHGTHLQRLRAAQWGDGVAANAPNQGHVYPAATMLELFEAFLPELVAPDAS